MISRTAAPRRAEFARYYPIVAITGPRQAGKTTLVRCFYPPLYDREIPPQLWFADYVATYVERDVRRLIQVRDLESFHRFVLMCAARTGQLLNLSSLAADCGITHNTAHAWLGVLEASYLVTRLAPFHRNFGKRLTKAPKLYFLDTGLAAWLAGVRDAATLATGAMRGPLFETFVVAEFVKRRRHALRAEELHFWRDAAGNEIDLLVTRGDAVLAAVECKSGRTVAEDWFAPLARFASMAGNPPTLLIHGGDTDQARTTTPVYGWRSIGRVLDRVFD